MAQALGKICLQNLEESVSLAENGYFSEIPFSATKQGHTPRPCLKPQEVNVSRTRRNRFLLQKMDILFENSNFGVSRTGNNRFLLQKMDILFKNSVTKQPGPQNHVQQHPIICRYHETEWSHT